MRTLQWFRFAIFGIWIVTVAAVLLTFIATMLMRRMTDFGDVRDSLGIVMALVMPQVGVMLGFFFGTTKAAQKRILKSERPIAALSVYVSLFYHVVFWLLLFVGIYLGKLGKSIDDNAIAVAEIMGLVAVIGLSPVAYLFARATDSTAGE